MSRTTLLREAGRLVDQALALDIQSYSVNDTVRSRAMRKRADELRAMAQIKRLDARKEG